MKINKKVFTYMSNTTIANKVVLMKNHVILFLAFVWECLRINVCSTCGFAVKIL